MSSSFNKAVCVSMLCQISCSFYHLRRAVQLDNSSLVCDRPTFALRTSGRNLIENKQTKLFEDIWELPLRQWVFEGLRSEKKKKAKSCEPDIWPHSPLKAMAIFKAVAKRLSRIKAPTVLQSWEKEANGVYICPWRKDPRKSIRVSVGSWDLHTKL